MCWAAVAAPYAQTLTDPANFGGSPGAPAQPIFKRVVQGLQPDWTERQGPAQAPAVPNFFARDGYLGFYSGFVQVAGTNGDGAFSLGAALDLEADLVNTGALNLPSL
jgi:hypothetical protein